VAIGFKVTPIVLVPFWALATVPRVWFTDLSSATAMARLGGGLALRCGMVGALTVLACLPFYLIGGPGCLSFLTYHKDRGIECETTYAAALGMLRPLGLKLGCQGRYGAFEVVGDYTPLLASVAPLVIGVPLLLVVAAYFRQLRREARGEVDSTPLGLVGPTFLALLIFLMGNKVLSPQYFLWLLPLAPLMPLSDGARPWFLWGIALVYGLTFCVFPLAGRHLIGQGDFSALSGPTLLGALILSARSLAMLAVAVGLAVALFRAVRKGRS
jgi:hypothetical protein